MDEKTALARRLAAYSATAGVALAVAAEVDGQIVYHDVVPDLVTCYYDRLDVDDDGGLDVLVDASCYSARYSLFFANLRGTGNSQNGVLGYPTFPSAYSYLASRLAKGDMIGPTKPGRGFYARVQLAGASSGPGYPGGGPFRDAEGYAGFRFVGGDGETHYGWIRLSVPYWPLSITTYEYGYESRPDTPIAAGEFDVAMTGTVEQRHFPPEGGLFEATVTLTNGTAVALPLDLWFEAEHEGGAVSTGRFGSGTLAAGAMATRRIAFRIQPDVPAGAYDVRLKVGRQSTGRVLSFQPFEITKAPGAGESGVGESLIAVATPGDLFAAAEASAAAGTHALSAPSPNPATAQTALTLSVAEAQQVRVEVLDALGRRVALLHDGPMAAGEAQRLVFDGSALPVGVYVVRAVGAAFADARVVTLAR